MALRDVEETKYTKLMPLGYQASGCGYCKDDSGASYYVQTDYMLPSHYQALMDRGWRRSGSVMYLPDLVRSCCPHYTIRLPLAEFRPSRDQRQAQNRWNRFVLGDEYQRHHDRKYPLSKTEKKAAESIFDLHKAVHKSELAQLKQDLKPAHRFQVMLEHDDFTAEKFELFKHYQRNVHKEKPSEISETGFRRFLCKSPVQRGISATGEELGSFHQCYRLDGRLIAMGVLDLLPHAVSGVYFIYHTDFEKYSMGKLSALREAALADEGGYGYYYMGYYIHGCDKMKYKATYQPQYVLDLKTYTWDPFDGEMRNLMDRQKFVSMSAERRRSQRIDENTKKTTAQDDERHSRMVDMTDQEQKVPEDIATTSHGQEEHPENDPSDQERRAPEDNEEYTMLDVKAATAPQNSLLTIGMPGVLTQAEFESQIDQDDLLVAWSEGKAMQLSASPNWHGSSLDQLHGLKKSVCELAACLGPDLLKQVLIEIPWGE